MRERLKRMVLKTAGLAITLLGLLLFALPLPFGIPLTAIGLVMLISTSRMARRIVRYLRLRFAAVDRLFTLVETHVPGPTRTVLRKTRRRGIGRRGIGKRQNARA